MSIEIVGPGLNFDLRKWIIIVMITENWECRMKLIWIWNTERSDQLASNSEEADAWDKFLSVWLFHNKDAECEDTSFVATENIKCHDTESAHLRF